MNWRAKIAFIRFRLHTMFIPRTILPLAFGVLAIAQSSCATTDLDPQCELQAASFDGKTPLSYAEIRAAPDEKVALYSKYPSLCTRSADLKCGSSARLVPGETVAIGTKCGVWAQVESFREPSVLIGWVNVRNLANERTIPVRRSVMQAGSPPLEPSFSLTKGFHRPICEAYIQRLNQTEFARPAYCGRPENDAIPGFSVLERDRISPTETKQLAPWVLAVTNPLTFLNQSQWQSMNDNRGVIKELPANPNLTLATAEVYGHDRSSWRYRDPLDINNDGKAVRVMIWSPDSKDNPRCGLPRSGPTPSSERTGEIAYVLASSGSDIDQRATIETFGYPNGGVYAPTNWRDASGKINFFRSFRPIGSSYGLIQYRGVFYFDTFFDLTYETGARDPNKLGDFRGHRKDDPTLRNTLGVFERKDGVTRQVCEYIVSPDQ